MNTVKVIEIDGVKYEFYFIGPTQALRILTRLNKILLPALGALIPKGEAKLMDLDLDQIGFEKAAMLLTERLDEDQVVGTIEEVLGFVKKSGGADLQIEADFLGKTGSLLAVFKTALEVNYKDFLSGIAGQFKKMKGKASTQGK